MTSVRRHRRRRALTGLLCAASAAWTADRASASAWNRAAGDGLAIFDFTLGSGTDYFNGAGRLAPARAYSKREIAGYVEYGATDWLMLVARPSLDSIRVGAPDAGHYVGLGSSAVGAQLHVLAFGPAVLAVQGTFSLPGSTSRRNPAEIGNTAREGDLRVLGGVAFALGRFVSFIDAQGSYRIRSDGASAQWHGDLTFGLYPTAKLLLLLQSFTAVPTGPGDDWYPSSRSSKLALSGVYELTPAWALQLGVFATVYGRDALRERGFTTGLWYRF